MDTWYIRTDWSGITMTPARLFEVLEPLAAAHSGVGSVRPDGSRFTVQLAVEADTSRAALDSATEAVIGALSDAEAADVDLVGFEVLDSLAMERGLDTPVYPDVVGYAEIAEMAGVSRQRARAFRDSPGFPAPVIETAQGPLMLRAAVARWLETRNTRPGPRPA